MVERSEKIQYGDETDTAILNEWRLQTLLQLSEMADASIQDAATFAMEEGIRLTRSKIGYLAFMEQDESVLKMYAWSKVAMEECKIAGKPLEYSLATTGLLGEAVRQRRPIITNDYQAPSPWKKGYPPGHVELIRHMNIPIFDGETIVAVAGVANKDEPYDETDVRLLRLLMDGMWRIISRKRTVETMRKLNRALRMLSRCNHLVAHADREADLLGDVCRVMVEEGGYHLAWIGFATAETEEVLCPVVQAGFEEKGWGLEELLWSGAVAECQPLHAALHTAMPVIWRCDEDGKTEGLWTTEANRLGYASFLVLPLLTDGRAMGTLVVYSTEPDTFTEEETRHLMELTNSLVLGIVSLRNRTEREEAEARVRKLNAELEERVRDRTGQLESFSYSISHDLRTPLRSISGFAEILMTDYAHKLDDDGRDCLHRILAGVRRLDRLINDLLELFRITRSEVEVKDVDLSRIVNAVAEELTLREPDRRVEFVIQPDVKVLGDRRLLAVALENLLGNAWKFTRMQPTARIEFGTTRVSGRTACFVRDDGVGFDMVYATKLFDPFERLHPQSDFEGTGIGLSIVRRIVQHHHGRIWAEGKKEKGATFYFTLELKPAE